MLYKNKVAILKSRELEFEDLLRDTAQLLRKEMQQKARPVTVSKKPSAA
jgi:hypothetical protein